MFWNSYMFYYMYIIINHVNNKFYVGVHKTKNLNDGYMGSGKVLRHAIKKYGKDSFTKIIYETFASSSAMYERERMLVTEDFVKRFDVYNIKPGGYGGFDYINEMKLNNSSMNNYLGGIATKRIHSLSQQSKKLSL